MSNVNNQSNNYIDWLERSVADEHIICYEYLDFKNIQKIGNGAFGSVYRATWKNHFFALKSLNDNTQSFEEVVKEVQIFLLML